MKRKRSAISTIVFVVFCTWQVSAQFEEGPYQPPKPAGSMPGPQRNPSAGIYSHQVYSAISRDALNWTKEGKLIFDHASVPDALITKEGTIFVYFMDASQGHQMSVAKSRDLAKTWTKDAVEIDGKMASDAVDPNPLLTDDGKIRMFYFGSFFSRGDPAKNPGNHEIYSAISDDGIHFTKEPGVRFSHPHITDPDVIKINTGPATGRWKMFLAMGQTDISTSSSDGMTFTKDPVAVSNNGAVSKTIAVDGGWRLFKCGNNGIASQWTADFLTWREEGTRLQREPGQMMCDPAVIRFPDGTYKMFYKTAPAQYPLGQRSKRASVPLPE